jgi:hypothetical protein
MPDRADFYRCPLCRGKTAERVVVARPSGTAYRTQFFRCGICSNVFMDPLALTRGFEDRPLTSQEHRGGVVYDLWGRINKARKEDKSRDE